MDGLYQRAAFHGVPGGKEINSFVIGIYNAAGPGQEISRAAIKKIGKLKRPADVKICVSLACHHSVSYTHLDVYKRQAFCFTEPMQEIPKKTPVKTGA